MTVWSKCERCQGWGCLLCDDSGMVSWRDWSLFWAVWRGWAYGALAGLLIILGLWAWANPL